MNGRRFAFVTSRHAEGVVMPRHTCTANLSQHIVASIHDDGIVFFDTQEGRLFASNQTGARIWQCLERKLAADAIAAEISSEYGIAYETARDHTTRFLADLEQQKLIELKGGA
jgi:predicted flavoprotein YhiN